MNYKVVNDKEILDNFINILPDLHENECYYCCLFSRSKYAKNEDGSNKFPHIKTDKSQLKRFTLTKKEDLYWKLKQLECEFGLYRTKDDDEVPKESLAVYITINPRNQMKALFKLSKRLLEIIESKGTNFNIHQEAMSMIQKSRSRSIYVTFDIDIDHSDEQKVLSDLHSITPEESFRLLKTRGGYHVLIDPTLVSNKTWYMKIKNLEYVDSSVGVDAMIPIPGTYQGGYTPHFIK